MGMLRFQLEFLVDLDSSEGHAKQAIEETILGALEQRSWQLQKLVLGLASCAGTSLNIHDFDKAAN